MNSKTGWTRIKPEWMVGTDALPLNFVYAEQLNDKQRRVTVAVFDCPERCSFDDMRKRIDVGWWVRFPDGSETVMAAKGLDAAHWRDWDGITWRMSDMRAIREHQSCPWTEVEG